MADRSNKQSDMPATAPAAGLRLTPQMLIMFRVFVLAGADQAPAAGRRPRSGHRHHGLWTSHAQRMESTVLQCPNAQGLN
jgi:hypothetical protein